jgi:hypothetical protein
LRNAGFQWRAGTKQAHEGDGMKTRVMIALAVLAMPVSASAADEPKAFSCEFNEGLTYTYDKGAFISEKASPLSFGIEAINAAAQTAALKTRGGTGQLRIVQAVNAMHFLEIVTEGFMHITTVYDKDEAKGAYPAVHSRHFGLFGQPLVTQYQGFCRATD